MLPRNLGKRFFFVLFFVCRRFFFFFGGDRRDYCHIKQTSFNLLIGYTPCMPRCQGERQNRMLRTSETAGTTEPGIKKQKVPVCVEGGLLLLSTTIITFCNAPWCLWHCQQRMRERGTQGGLSVETNRTLGKKTQRERK